jgi:prefoldin alpha subunit
LSTPSQEDQFRRLAYEIQLMQGTAETLQQRLALLQGAISDVTVARESLAGLKEVEEGVPILVHAGGGTFINANLGDLEKVIVNIGADVSIDMDLEGAQEDIAGRLDELLKSSQATQQQLEEVVAQMQIRRDALNRLSAGLGGEAPGV